MTALRLVSLAVLLAAGCLGAPDEVEAPKQLAPAQTTAQVAARPKKPSPPRPDDVVKVFHARTGEWRATPLREVPAGGEFLHDGFLLRLVGTQRLLQWVHDVDVRHLAEADRSYEDGPHLRWPTETDVVLVTGEKPRHCLLTRVQPGERFAFQGRLFDTRQGAGGLEVAYSGHTIRRVTRTYQRQADTLIDLAVRYEATGKEGVISGTPEHPFFVPERKDYVPLGEISPGTVLHTSDGTLARVVKSSRRHGDFTVHNLEVEGAHNYFVKPPDTEAPAVLVHNTCGPQGGVYKLLDPETGQVMRTGRTNNLARREVEHAADPALEHLRFEAVYETNIYKQQRGLEQVLHDMYNPPLNKLRPISPLNPHRQSYMDAAREFLENGGGG